MTQIQNARPDETEILARWRSTWSPWCRQRVGAWWFGVGVEALAFVEGKWKTISEHLTTNPNHQLDGRYQSSLGVVSLTCCFPPAVTFKRPRQGYPREECSAPLAPGLRLSLLALWRPAPSAIAALARRRQHASQITREGELVQIPGCALLFLQVSPHHLSGHGGHSGP